MRRMRASRSRSHISSPRCRGGETNGNWSRHCGHLSRVAFFSLLPSPLTYRSRIFYRYKTARGLDADFGALVDTIHPEKTHQINHQQWSNRLFACLSNNSYPILRPFACLSNNRKKRTPSTDQKQMRGARVSEVNPLRPGTGPPG